MAAVADDVGGVQVSERVLVCGGRNYTKRAVMWSYLKDLPAGTVIIEGGARGADRLAREIARENGLTVETYRADWDKHGNAAGPIRNQRMIDEGKPTRAFAFPDPDSRGTWDMVRRLEKAKIPTVVVVP